jgi:uncharacterized protein with ATP-grasp and redox domains
MKSYLDCIPCFLDQALRAGRIATRDEKKIKKLLDAIGSMIKEFPLENSPPETGDVIYRKVREITGVDDPFKEIKKSNINEALALYPEMKEIVNRSDNRLLTAIKLSIAGNIIDLGVRKKYNLMKGISEVLKQDFAISYFDRFVAHLGKAKSILYLGDNAGESVFDKLLIEELHKPVTYVVREIPVINDVTLQDAIDSGLDTVAEIISSGSSAPATILHLCNDEFINRFNSADMIISKGQGNYEGLSGVKRPVFFLLKAKCHVIAKDLGVDEDDIVLKSTE